MVETAPYDNNGGDVSAWDILQGQSIPGLKFTFENPPGSGQHTDLGIGTSYTICTTEEPKSRQAIDFDTKQPKTYASDNRPILEVVITGQLLDFQPLDEEDTGLRRLYLNSTALKRALQDEMKEKKIQRFGPGTYLRITHVGYGQPSKPGGRAPKSFKIEILQATEYVSQAAQQVQQALQSLPQGQPQQAPVQQGGWYDPNARQVPAPVQQFAQPQQFPQVPPPTQFQHVVQAMQTPQFPQAPIPQVPQFPQAPIPQVPQMPQAPIPQVPQMPQAPVQIQQAAPAPSLAPAQVPQVAGPVITQEYVQRVQSAMAAGFDLETAVAATAAVLAPGDEAFALALKDNIPF